MRVLVACEESATVRDAFRKYGHDAWSCDLQPCSGDPRWHIQSDIMLVGREGWDLVIAHPVCQYLANSGSRWFYDENGEPNRNRWSRLNQAREFFMQFFDWPVPRLCIENPIPHGHAGLPLYTQCIQPWQFGDNYSKATCLWLRGLPPLVPQVLAKPPMIVHACHLEPPGPERAKNRSKTYPGIAKAMAQQWGTDWVPQLRLEHG